MDNSIQTKNTKDDDPSEDTHKESHIVKALQSISLNEREHIELKDSDCELTHSEEDTDSDYETGERRKKKKKRKTDRDDNALSQTKKQKRADRKSKSSLTAESKICELCEHKNKITVSLKNNGTEVMKFYTDESFAPYCKTSENGIYIINVAKKYNGKMVSLCLWHILKFMHLNNVHNSTSLKAKVLEKYKNMLCLFDIIKEINYMPFNMFLLDHIHSNIKTQNIKVIEASVEYIKEILDEQDKSKTLNDDQVYMLKEYMINIVKDRFTNNADELKKIKQKNLLTITVIFMSLWYALSNDV